jgi:hypothetical protein
VVERADDDAKGLDAEAEAEAEEEEEQAEDEEADEEEEEKEEREEWLDGLDRLDSGGVEEGMEMLEAWRRTLSTSRGLPIMMPTAPEMYPAQKSADMLLSLGEADRLVSCGHPTVHQSRK